MRPEGARVDQHRERNRRDKPGQEGPSPGLPDAGEDVPEDPAHPGDAAIDQQQHRGRRPDQGAAQGRLEERVHDGRRG